ncbi:twin-arginine translocase subunit TatC [Microbacterium deminutum]
MTLAAHLREFRRRLLISAGAVVIGLVVGWCVSGIIWTWMRQPITDIALAQNRNATLNFPNLTAAFDLKMQLAMLVAVVISSPVWLYQIFAFFVPGLTRRERRYTFGFFAAAVPVFAAGCVTGWFVVPQVVAVLTSFAPTEDASIMDAGLYFAFIMKLMLALGIAFELPVFLVLLNAMGVVPAVTIRRSWRSALLLIFVFTAIATPAADVLSMFLLALPIVMLYVTAAVVAEIHDRRQAKRTRSLTVGDPLASLSADPSREVDDDVRVDI